MELTVWWVGWLFCGSVDWWVVCLVGWLVG